MPYFEAVCEFEIAYAHRLPGHKGKCRHLHGHNGIVQVAVKSETLDANGMVMDFGDLKAAAKAWLDENLDHKTLLYEQDHLAEQLAAQGEPIRTFAFMPTAENLAEFIFGKLNRLGLKVAYVRFAETRNSWAVYTGE